MTGAVTGDMVTPDVISTWVSVKVPQVFLIRPLLEIHFKGFLIMTLVSPVAFSVDECCIKRYVSLCHATLDVNYKTGEPLLICQSVLVAWQHLQQS